MQDCSLRREDGILQLMTVAATANKTTETAKTTTLYYAKSKSNCATLTDTAKLTTVARTASRTTTIEAKPTAL